VVKENDKVGLIEQFYKRASDILSKENVKFDKNVLGKVVVDNFPDYRRTLNEVQRFSRANGERDSGILSQSSSVDVDSLFKAIKNKKYNKVREWVVESLDNDQSKIFRQIYDSLKEYLEPASVPIAVIHLGKYQYQAAFVADPEINLMAFLTEIWVDCELK